MADKKTEDSDKKSEDKGKEFGKSKYIATRTANVGTKKDGSAKIKVKRWKEYRLNKDQADTYRKHKLI